MRKPTSVETFAGGGGFLLGSRAAGFDTRLAVDIAPKPLSVLKDYLPELNVLAEDFLKLTPDAILERAGLKEGELDHFHGSWPCQEFSTVNSAGRKKVEAGDEGIYRLLHHLVDTIIAIRPKVFTGENVPGAVSGDALRVLRIAVGRLRAAGYDVSIVKVNCLNYGIPQDRVRVLLLGKLAELPGRITMPAPSEVDHSTLTIGSAYPGVRAVVNTSFGQRFYNASEYLPTVTATWSLKFLDDNGWRKPTIAELLAAQTFPPDYEQSISKLSYLQAHKLIGNAVPCRLAEVVMRQMRNYL
jgi:site-specific DNA-cytosine methylase